MGCALSELVQWAGRTLHGRDRFGWWKIHSKDGWDDSPETKGETESIPNGDGEYDLPIYNEARIITVTGRILTSSHEQLHQAGLYLTGAMKGRFQVSGHGPTLWVDMKRQGSVKFKPVTNTLAQWQVVGRAVDPVKYGDTNTFAVPNGTSYVNLFHWGNTSSQPFLTITGNMPGGYEIQSAAGARYRVTRALLAGETHTIDMRDGMLQINGSYAPGIGARADIWRIPSGSTATTIRIQAITTGTATMTAAVTDSFI
jgi:hypothetical protein